MGYRVVIGDHKAPEHARDPTLDVVDGNNLRAVRRELGDLVLWHGAVHVETAHPAREVEFDKLGVPNRAVDVLRVAAVEPI